MSRFPGKIVRMRIDGRALVIDNEHRVDSNALFGQAGAVTQGTNNNTAVTLNATNGRITMNAAVANGAGHDFTFTNAAIRAASQLFLQVQATTATAAATRVNTTIAVVSQTAGSAVLHVFNGDAAATSAAPIINFLVLNGTSLG
jgi:transcription elongation factor